MIHYLWWRYHVRSQRAAMVLLAAPDFEFGRYADTLVNVVLAVGGWEQGERVKNDGFLFAPPVRTMMKHMKIKVLQHQVHVMKSLIGGMLPLGQRYGVWYVPSVEFTDFCNEVTMFFFPGWLHHHWYNLIQFTTMAVPAVPRWLHPLDLLHACCFTGAIFHSFAVNIGELGCSSAVPCITASFPAQPFCLESCLGSFRTMAEWPVSQAMVRCHPHQLSEVWCLIWWFLMLDGMQHANSTFYTVFFKYFNQHQSLNVCFMFDAPEPIRYHITSILWNRTDF